VVVLRDIINYEIFIRLILTMKSTFGLPLVVPCAIDGVHVEVCYLIIMLGGFIYYNL